MSVNAYKPHVLVLPEDDANRQIANGFQLEPALNLRRIQILPPSGGWGRVLEAFRQTHVPELARYPERRVVLLIDFDQEVESRSTLFRECVPANVHHRVYLLGTQSEPERLKADLGCSLETIGLRLAEACSQDRADPWDHALLRHNHADVVRLRADVKPFLFN